MEGAAAGAAAADQVEAAVFFLEPDEDEGTLRVEIGERQLAVFEANVTVVVFELELFSGTDFDPAARPDAHGRPCQWGWPE